MKNIFKIIESLIEKKINNKHNILTRDEIIKKYPYLNRMYRFRVEDGYIYYIDRLSDNVEKKHEFFKNVQKDKIFIQSKDIIFGAKREAYIETSESSYMWIDNSKIIELREKKVPDFINDYWMIGKDGNLYGFPNYFVKIDNNIIIKNKINIISGVKPITNGKNNDPREVFIDTNGYVYYIFDKMLLKMNESIMNLKLIKKYDSYYLLFFEDGSIKKYSGDLLDLCIDSINIYAGRKVDKIDNI